MAVVPARRLRPLILVLGGIRHAGEVRVDYRQEPKKRRSRTGDELQIDKRERSVIVRPEEYRWARRFVRNASAWLANFYVRTPIGNFALKSQEHVMLMFRERASHEAALLNPEHEKWQVLVELACEDVTRSGDAESQLLTMKAEDLPALFFEREGARATQEENIAETVIRDRSRALIGAMEEALKTTVHANRPYRPSKELAWQ